MCKICYNSVNPIADRSCAPGCQEAFPICLPCLDHLAPEESGRTKCPHCKEDLTTVAVPEPLSRTQTILRAERRFETREARKAAQRVEEIGDWDSQPIAEDLSIFADELTR